MAIHFRSVSRSASRTSITGYSRSASHAIVQYGRADRLLRVCVSSPLSCPHAPQFFPYTVKTKDRNMFSQSPSWLTNVHGMSYHLVIYSSLNAAAMPTSLLAFVAYWNVVHLQSNTAPVQFMLRPTIFFRFFVFTVLMSQCYD